MLILKILPYLYIFYFDITVYLAAYPYRVILAIYPGHYAAELPPLRQALLKRGKPTYPDLLVSEHYRVGGQELAYQLLVLLQGRGVYRE